MLDKTLLEIIVCPHCKGPLDYEREGNEERLVCKAEKLAYAVRDGIPILLFDQAQDLSLAPEKQTSVDE